MCWWARACHTGRARAAGVAAQLPITSFLPHPPLSWTSILTLVCPILEAGASVLQTEEDAHF